MKNDLLIIGGYDHYIPVPYKRMKIGLASTDIVVGIVLTNESDAPVFIYDNKDGTGSPSGFAKPGEVIGTVLKIDQGPGGPSYYIETSLTGNSFLFFPGTGYVLYTELKSPVNATKPAVTQATVQTQIATLQQTDPNIGDWISGVPNWLTVTGFIAGIVILAPPIIERLPKSNK